MLTAVLFVLKIIGWTLLVILGLILFLVLAVLLIPIRYRAEGSYQSEPAAKAAVSWFLHMLSLTMVYEKTLRVRIRILGIPVKCFDGNSEAVEEAKVPDVSESKMEASEPIKSEPKKTVSKKTEPKKKISQTSSDAEKRQQEKREPVWNRLKERCGQFYGRWNAVWSWVQKEENKQMLCLVKRQIFGIVRHILPGTISGRIKFGFDDPFQTGQILTYVSPFYGLYAKKLELIPVFEESVLEGEVRMTGRIRIGTILAKTVRLLFNKNIRKTIRQFRGR